MFTLLKNSDIKKIFEIFAQNNPSPKGELNYTNSYTLLVAVALSAQATDISVNKATKSLFEIVQTPQDMLNLGEDGLKQYIRTIGLYNSKAKNIISMARMLVDIYDGEVPKDGIELEKLAGVGRKTANVVRNIAFGEATIAIDTHIFRISRRIGLSDAKTTLGIEKDLIKKIPKKFLYHAHHWLILHGRYICKARNPECNKCVISHICVKNL